jgi:hypothetical protein
VGVRLKTSALHGRFFLPGITPVLMLAFFLTAPKQQAMGQQAYRIKADCSVKSKTVGTSDAGLVMGTVFYDLRIGRLIFDVKFPQQET